MSDWECKTCGAFNSLGASACHTCNGARYAARSPKFKKQSLTAPAATGCLSVIALAVLLGLWVLYSVLASVCWICK